MFRSSITLSRKPLVHYDFPFPSSQDILQEAPKANSDDEMLFQVVSYINKHCPSFTERLTALLPFLPLVTLDSDAGPLVAPPLLDTDRLSVRLLFFQQEGEPAEQPPTFFKEEMRSLIEREITERPNFINVPSKTSSSCKPIKGHHKSSEAATTKSSSKSKKSGLLSNRKRKTLPASLSFTFSSCSSEQLLKEANERKGGTKEVFSLSRA